MCWHLHISVYDEMALGIYSNLSLFSYTSCKYTTQKKIYSVHEDNLFAIQIFLEMTLFIEKNLTIY